MNRQARKGGRKPLRVGADPRLHRLAYALAPGLLIVLWWTASSRLWLPPQILPSPVVVWHTAEELLASGELLGSVLISLGRVMVGLGAGAVAGLLLGAWTGLSRQADIYIRPSFTMISQVPNLGWIPLLVLFFGLGETLKIAIIAKAAFIPMMLNVADGMRNTPRQFVEVAQSFRFSRWKLLRFVVLPAAVPAIFTGLRLSLSKAWATLVAVELLASSEWLGYLLVWGRQMFWMDLVILAMIVTGIIGFAMDALLDRAEKYLLGWKAAS